MAENSSPSGMELVKLPEEDLLKIFSYLDWKYQLNTMLVCRCFERLIGQTYQFYKNRKLVVRDSSKLLGKRFREESNRMQTRSSKRKCLASDNFLPF
jgi:hypothetical protein